MKDSERDVARVLVARGRGRGTASADTRCSAHTTRRGTSSAVPYGWRTLGWRTLGARFLRTTPVVLAVHALVAAAAGLRRD